VAHLGAAVLLVGVAGTATGAHVGGVLGPGQSVTVRGYVLRLDRIAEADADGPGAAVRATVDVSSSSRGHGGRHLATLRPVAMLAGAGERVSVAGLRSTPFEDLQVNLRAVGPRGESAVVDVTVLPLMQWVWWGGLLIVAALARVGADHGRNHAVDRRPQPSAGLVHEVPSRAQP
jgi:cytochrome c-type biogenesis protein CcmF